GSIVTLGPIVIALADKSDSPLGLIGACLLSGAMFGDNLSLISDTTIAATQSLGCQMKDKFRFNSKIALPAALVAIVLLVAIGLNQETSAAVQEFKEFNLILVLPYILVVALSLAGLNVFVVLFAGLVFAGLLGFGVGSFGCMGFATKADDGFRRL